jgi:hypothetical protein
MIIVILEIDDVKRNIIHLTFKNESLFKTFHLPASRTGMSLEIFDGNYFEFNKPASFIGPQIKRPPYLGEELITLKPEENIVTDRFRLDDFYDLSPTLPFQARYKAPTTLFPPEQIMLASPWVNFA